MLKTVKFLVKNLLVLGILNINFSMENNPMNMKLSMDKNYIEIYKKEYNIIFNLVENKLIFSKYDEIVEQQKLVGWQKKAIETILERNQSENKTILDFHYLLNEISKYYKQQEEIQKKTDAIYNQEDREKAWAKKIMVYSIPMGLIIGSIIGYSYGKK